MLFEVLSSCVFAGSASSESAALAVALIAPQERKQLSAIGVISCSQPLLENSCFYLSP